MWEALTNLFSKRKLWKEVGGGRTFAVEKPDKHYLKPGNPGEYKW